MSVSYDKKHILNTGDVDFQAAGQQLKPHLVLTNTSYRPHFNMAAANTKKKKKNINSI